MLNQFSRTELIIGKEAVEKLHKSKVAIFGIGGVGAYVVEGLVRAGIGNFILVDNDKVDITNLNRQLIATTKTIGMPKVEVAKQRILEINPKAKVDIYQEFFMPESREILNKSINYVVDSIDTVTAKIELVVRANRLNIPIISCMGTGNKLTPKFEIMDLSKTKYDPIAKILRKYVKDQRINEKVMCCYSEEIPISSTSKSIPSMMFVPSSAGLLIASYIVRSFINK